MVARKREKLQNPKMFRAIDPVCAAAMKLTRINDCVTARVARKMGPDTGLPAHYHRDLRVRA